MQNEGSPVFPQKYPCQDQQGSTLSACRVWMSAVTHWWLWHGRTSWSPQQLQAQTTTGRGGKRPHPTPASTSTARDDGSDRDREEAAQRTQPGLGSICSLWGTCSISQFQDSSHQSQIICCNIVAGSYSRFAEVCDVLGLPQSTAGERYEISIYIPQPGQESDNWTAEAQGERSSLERQEGQGRSLESLGNGDPAGCSEHPAPLPWGSSPSSSILHFDNVKWLSGPSWGWVNEGSSTLRRWKQQQGKLQDLGFVFQARL